MPETPRHSEEYSLNLYGDRTGFILSGSVFQMQ